MSTVLDFAIFEKYLQPHSMLAPIASKTTERETYNGYLIFQVGIPEVEEFIRKFHK